MLVGQDEAGEGDNNSMVKVATITTTLPGTVTGSVVLPGPVGGVATELPGPVGGVATEQNTTRKAYCVVGVGMGVRQNYTLSKSPCKQASCKHPSITV